MKGNNLQIKHQRVIAEILEQCGRLWSRKVGYLPSELPLPEGFMIWMAHVGAAEPKLELK